MFELYRCCFFISLIVTIPIGYVSGRVFHKTVKGIEQCQPDGPISDLRELNGCSKIYGDLVIHPKNIRTTDAKIIDVLGCIHIENTLLYDLEFLYNLKSVNCSREHKIFVKNNKYLCVDDKQTKAFEILHGNINVQFTHCPTCSPDLIEDLSEIASRGCQSYTDSLIWDIPGVFPRSLKVVNGRLVFKNTVIDPNFEYGVSVTWMGAEPAVSFENTSIPNIELIGGQGKFKVFTDAGTALQIVNISGYRMPRENLAFLKDQYWPKNVRADAEEDGDCYFDPNENEKVPLRWYLGCVRLFGKISLSTEGGYAKSDVVGMESLLDIDLYEKDGQLLNVFGNVQQVNLFNNSYLNVFFSDDVCFKKEVFLMIRTWLADEDKKRIRFGGENTTCHTYIGHITTQDLYWDDGKRMKYIIGSLELEDLPFSEMPAGVTSNYDKFSELLGIKKTPDIPSNKGALIIEMCGTRVPLPDFIFKVDVQSMRDEDLLIEVFGPGYKMHTKDYNRLKNKYGSHRLAIDAMLSSDCHFSRPIKSLAELVNCTRVIGDLTIMGRVSRQEAKVKIRYVSGCIKIVETNLISLDFLDFFDPYDPADCIKCNGEDAFAIQDNPLLCVNEVKFPNAKRYVKNNAIHCLEEKAENDIVRKNFVIFREYNESELWELSKIKVIYGKVVISHLDVDYMNVFSSVKQIVYTGSGIALHIHHNKNLKEFPFPSLENITVFGKGMSLVMEHNDELLKSEDVHKLHKKFGGQHKVLISNDISAEKDSPDMWKGIGIGLGVGLGSALIIAGFVVGTVMIAVVIRKKTVKRKINSRKEKNSANREETAGLVSVHELDPKIEAKMKSRGKNDEYQPYVETKNNESVVQTESNVNNRDISIFSKAKTASLAEVGSANYDGNLRNNNSVLQKGKTYHAPFSKENEIQGNQNSNSLSKNGKTAMPAKIGNNDYHGYLYDNKSVNIDKKPDARDKVNNKGNLSIFRAAQTARTAFIGKKIAEQKNTSVAKDN